MDTFTLVLLEPDRELTIGNVEELLVKTKDGELGILSHHIDRLSNLVISERKVKYNGAFHLFAIGGGTLSFRQKENKAVLCLESFEEDKDIDMVRAEKAKKTAEDRLKQKLSLVEETKFQIRLERAINRIRVKNSNR